MSEQVVPVTRECPNCGSHNYPNASVCESCGITLGAFERALPEIEKRKQDASNAHLQQLQAEATAEVRDQVRAGRKTISIQIVLALGAALVFLALIAGVAGWNSYQQQLRRERLAAMYERAKLCFGQNDFRCARDEFGAILKEEADYRDARTLWQQSRLGYAEQQIGAGRWQSAIAELQQVLSSAPNQARGLELLNRARLGLAAQYSDQGRGDQAIGELQKILLVAPSDANALALLKQVQVSLAATYAQEGEFQNAVNLLERALTRFRDDPELIALLKNIYDQWYNDAVSRGDWFTALSVSAQRNFRFSK